MQGLLRADVVPPRPTEPTKKGCAVDGGGAGGLLVVALMLALGRGRRPRR